MASFLRGEHVGSHFSAGHEKVAVRTGRVPANNERLATRNNLSFRKKRCTCIIVHRRNDYASCASLFEMRIKRKGGNKICFNNRTCYRRSLTSRVLQFCLNFYLCRYFVFRMNIIKYLFLYCLKYLHYKKV